MVIGVASVLTCCSFCWICVRTAGLAARSASDNWLSLLVSRLLASVWISFRTVPICVICAA
jgi:hypothetical protein